MKFRPAMAALSMTLALAACGELPFGQSEPEVPAHTGPPTVSPLDQPIETGAESKPVSTAEAATLNTPIIRASGNEPFWAVTADGNTAVYERPGARSTGISVRRIPYARGVEFIGAMNGRAFSLNVQAGECTDSMSGQKFPFTARLSAGGQRQTGCAGPTETMPRAQTRASTGTAQPRATSSSPAAAAPAPSRPAAAESSADTTSPSRTDEQETTTAPATQPETPAASEERRSPAGTGSGTAAPGDAPSESTGADRETAPASPAPVEPETPDADENATADTPTTGAADAAPAAPESGAEREGGPAPATTPVVTQPRSGQAEADESDE